MHDLVELKNQLFRELEKISSRGELNSQILEVVYKALCSLNTIMEIEEKENSSYSMRSSYRSMPRMYYDGGYSDKRDSRGRYSSTGATGDDFMSRLEDAMMSAPDEKSKQELERIVTRMRGGI